MKTWKLLFVCAVLLALALPVARLSMGRAQLNVTGGALTGVTTMPNYMPMGEISMIGNGTATTNGVSGTYVLAAGTTTLSGDSVLFDMPQNGRLRYTGATTAKFHIACTMSYTVASGSNQEFRARIYKGGVAIDSSEIRDQLSNSSGVESTAIHTYTTLAQNEYLELFVTNQSGTPIITVVTQNLFALGDEII